MHAATKRTGSTGKNTSTPSSMPSTSASHVQRPKEPLFYLLGRSGHGKSSLIRALANQAVSPSSTPNTTSEKWKVILPDETPCTLVESHIIFEQSSRINDSFTTKLEHDLTLYKPCAILFVLSCSKVKYAAEDFEVLKEFFKSNKEKQHFLIPVFVVLTIDDAYFDKRLWPIADHKVPQVLLTTLLDYIISKDVLTAATYEPMQTESLYCGYVTQGCEPFQGIVPTATLLTGKEKSWNINNLQLLLKKAHNKDEQPYDFRTDIVELQKVLDEVKSMFEILCKENSILDSAYEKCRQTALLPLVKFLEDLIEKARAPIVYLMGRSGHGKSSLVNALTNTKQAKVGHVLPTTPESEQYDIVFEGQNTAWKIVDSRGIFETTTAEGSLKRLATKQVIKDLKEYKPDIILHVINCSETRNLEADLKFVDEMFKAMKSDFGELPPVIVALSKADVFYHQFLWPIEKHADKQKKLEELLDYMSTPILSSGTSEPLDPSNKYYGCQLKGCEPFLYVVPVATLLINPPVIWNTERLNKLIGEQLPLEAWLHYYKTQKREKSMKELALKVINKMTVISSAIAAIPIPFVSFVFLMPLYVIMVSLIAKLAGREFSTNTAKEFLKSCKVWQGVAIACGAAVGAAFLAMTEVIETIVFGVGCAISIPATAAATYAVGRAAIAYFFDKEIEAPESYTKKWTRPQT